MESPAVYLQGFFVFLNPDSDIDILVKYFCEERQMKEYDLFNLFHTPDCMQRFILGGKVIDFNPITRD